MPDLYRASRNGPWTRSDEEPHRGSTGPGAIRVPIGARAPRHQRTFIMRVFVTGATGFIGSAVVKELLGAGHHVLGMTRSDAGAKSLEAAGAQANAASLEALESLCRGAAATDAVIHTAFRHDWSKFADACELDKRAIE